MDILKLLDIIKNQAQSSTIIFNNDFLTDAQITDLRNGFALGKNEYLEVHGVTPDEVTRSGNEVNVIAGKVDVLSRTGLSVGQVSLTIDENQNVQFIVSVILDLAGSVWQFGDSFPKLTIYPFDEIVANASRAIYDSRDGDYLAPWTDKPDRKIQLSKGLNLASWLTLDIFNGAATLLQEVLSATQAYCFSGPVVIDPSLSYPMMLLSSPLPGAAFTVPPSLAIDDLAVIIEISDADQTFGMQELSLRLAGDVDVLSLQFGAEIRSYSDVLSFYAEPMAGKTVGMTQIMQLPGGDNFSQYIPDLLKTAFNSATLQSFRINEAPDKSIALTSLLIGSNAGYRWEVVPQVFVLDSVALQLDVWNLSSIAVAVSFKASAKVLPNLFDGNFDVYVSVTNQSVGGWQVETVSGRYEGLIKLGDFVDKVVGVGVSLPPELAALTFYDFRVVAQNKGSDYSLMVCGNSELGMPIMDTELVAVLYAVATYEAGQYSVGLEGCFAIGGQTFGVTLNFGKSGTRAVMSEIVLSASWEADGPDDYLNFSDLAEAFGFADDLPKIPSGLDLALTSATFTYDYTAKELFIGFTSANYGKADLIALKNSGGEWRFFFGLGIDSIVPISNLPLIGDLLPSADTVQIGNLQVSIAVGDFDDGLATRANSLVASGYPKIPDTDGAGMKAGLDIGLSISIGGQDVPLALPLGPQDGGGWRVRSLAPIGSTTNGWMRLANPSVNVAASSDGTFWIDLQMTFGPVFIQKIGVRYDGAAQKLQVLVNMSLTTMGLTVGLLGFGIESPLSSFKPSFSIRGMDVTYSGEGVTVSGGLLGTFDPSVNFVGELLVDAEGFGVSGLAGYASTDGTPSLFAYVVVDAPLGALPCFFVTGLGGGLGFNRTLLVPDINGIETFPLVLWAKDPTAAPPYDPGANIGLQVNDALEGLISNGVIASQPGEFWLTAGVKFTSFDIVNSLALAILKFGREIEVDILGVTTIALPSDFPVIYAEFDLLASFRPSEGVVGIAGKLTPRSYVLEPQCHLTGGFAYYLWFDGAHAGDFVMTMGGYNPHFVVPDHYPNVSALGINWNVSGALVVKGYEYFAVTSAAVMVGGGLVASWHSGGVKAWFNLWADFLMVYRPFHYYIDARIDLGASFTIKLLFVHITVSVHVGASLAIWGPEFTGTATIDLGPITITIAFGSSGKQNDTTVPWPTFVNQMLPGIGQRKSQSLLPGIDGTRVSHPDTRDAANDGSGIRVSVTAGLVKTLSTDASKLDFIVNPETIELTIVTTIPLKKEAEQVHFVGLVELADQSLQPVSTPNDAFGVGPVGLSDDAFTPSLTISIKRTPSATRSRSAPEESDDLIPMKAVRILSTAPNSLWHKVDFDGHGRPRIADPLGDTTIGDVLVGYRIFATALVPDHTQLIDLANLQYTVDVNIQHFTWLTPYVPAKHDFGSETLEGSIMSSRAQANRAQLLPVLDQYVSGLMKSVDVAGMTDKTHAGLLSDPLLRLLGEEVA